MTDSSKNPSHECAALACIFCCIGVPCLLYSTISMSRASWEFDFVLWFSVASLIPPVPSCTCFPCLRILFSEKQGYSVQIDETLFNEEDTSRLRNVMRKLDEGKTASEGAPAAPVTNITITVTGSSSGGNAALEL